MPSIVFLPPAKSDIQSAIHWYEKQKTGLDKRFKKYLINAIDSLSDPIKGYGPVYMNLSRIPVRKFPYVIYFKIDLLRKKIVIYAVLHKKQSRENVLKERVE